MRSQEAEEEWGYNKSGRTMSAGSVQGQPSTRGATQHPRGQCHHRQSLLALATILGLGSPILSASGEGVFRRQRGFSHVPVDSWPLCKAGWTAWCQPLGDRRRHLVMDGDPGDCQQGSGFHQESPLSVPTAGKKRVGRPSPGTGHQWGLTGSAPGPRIWKDLGPSQPTALGVMLSHRLL